MAIQHIPPFRIRFLNLLHPNHPYQKPIIMATSCIGLYIGKTIARYIRDHNFNWLAQSNWASIRNAYRAYRYLFPENSARKYFMEVAIPDNLLFALIMETVLQTLPPPLDQPLRSNMKEVCIAVMRVFFIVYGINKVQQAAYEIIRRIPGRTALRIAVELAPTDVYQFFYPDGEILELRN